MSVRIPVFMIMKSLPQFVYYRTDIPIDTDGLLRDILRADCFPVIDTGICCIRIICRHLPERIIYICPVRGNKTYETSLCSMFLDSQSVSTNETTILVFSKYSTLYHFPSTGIDSKTLLNRINLIPGSSNITGSYSLLFAF